MPDDLFDELAAELPDGGSGDFADWLSSLEACASEDALFELLATQQPPESKLARQHVRGQLVKLLRGKLEELDSAASPAKTADAWLQEGYAADLQGQAFVAEEVEPWGSPVAGEDVLDELVGLYRAYVYASHEVLVVVTLWSAFSYVFDAFGISPILRLLSPTKRCGKTTLCIVLRHVCSRALLSGNLSPAAMYRAIEKWAPTLIVDEADSFAKLSEELRGILNAGHTRDTAFVLRAEGESNEPRVFSTWAPKVVAAIGHLPDTVEDRSIGAALVRKPTSVKKRDAFDPDGVRADCRDVRARLARWTNDNLEEIATTAVERPAGLNDREWNNWRPLLMIAGAAGAAWLEEATKAAQALCDADDDADAEDVKTLALRHVWEAVEPFEQMATADILATLVARDDGGPWAKWWEAKVAKGELKGPSAHLARLLRPFGIRSKQLWIDERNQRGYVAEDFKAEHVATYLEKDARDARDARPGSSSQAASSVPSDPSVFSGGARARVVVGDETYPALLAEALRNGHVTEPEAERRYLLHQKVARWLEMQGRA